MATRAKGAEKQAAVGETAEAAKPTRRRITRRQRVEQHVQEYYGALAERDLPRIVDLWSEEGVFDIVPLGVMRGRHEISGFFRELFDAVPDLETTIARVVPGEHEAAVEWRLSGHFTGEPFQGLEATGRYVEVRGLDLLEVADGKTVAVTAYYDEMSFARQVGAMPPRDSAADRALTTVLNAITRLRRALAERRAA